MPDAVERSTWRSRLPYKRSRDLLTSIRTRLHLPALHPTNNTPTGHQPFQGCCQRCSAINDNPDLKFWCHAFTTLIPPAGESAGSDKAEECRLVLSHRAEGVPSEPLSPAGGWSSLEGRADGWVWQEEEGAVSGVPLWDEDLVGAVPPYFSLLQVCFPYQPSARLTSSAVAADVISSCCSLSQADEA